MSEQLELMELAQRAQRGDRGALDRLAELASIRLRVYVYRLTLQEDLTSEIVQETLLEMCRVIGKLRRTDRFLPWLYGIATNKLRHFYRSEQTMKRATASKSDMEQGVYSHQEGLENLVSQELKEIVSQAIRGLKTNHRAVLIMRCYDGLSYAEIADSMGSSEFGTRMLFLRAKKALQKQLARQGLGRGTLLAALVLFGKMTSPSKVAAAQVSVTTATVNAGITAGVATAVSGKSALVSLAAVGAVTVGGLVHDARRTEDESLVDLNGRTHWSLVDTNVGQGMEKHWYYYPESPHGPLMMRAQFDPGPAEPTWVVMQNARANYLYDGSRLMINNAHWYARDLRVMRLPSDNQAFRSFLDRVEGQTVDLPSVRPGGPGMFVSTVRSGDHFREPKVSYSDDVLERDIFISDLVSDGKPDDRRDPMHHQGYAYFRVNGYISSKSLRGGGCIPFVSAARMQHRPWLNLSVGDLRVTDSRYGARFENRATGTIRSYPAGSLFTGLIRPWSGMHVLDTVRRDAAAGEFWFSTQDGDVEDQARVTVDIDDIDLIYTVDLDDDLLNRITLQRSSQVIGELVFTYTAQFPEGSLRRPPQVKTGRSQGRPGMDWLVDLVRQIEP